MPEEVSDEVSEFLRSVGELKERHDGEDEARTRELEEKVRQERRQRQARREERARSISPQKSSPANTPPPTSQPCNGLSLTSPSPDLGSQHPSQTSRDASESMDRNDRWSRRPPSPLKDLGQAPDLPPPTSDGGMRPSSPSTGMPMRSPTLSWQRRPTSQIAERPKSRPLSMVAAENAAARTSSPPVDANPTSERALTREQIANSLLSKDPAWFRQPSESDRGAKAFRKKQVEDEDTVSFSTARSELPGMRQIHAEAASQTKGRADAPREASFSQPFDAAPRLDPPAHPASEHGLDRSTMNTGRTSPTRPLSPTKGGGGFVQSAMMKRTDSVKRWSVASPAGLQRAGSVISPPTLDPLARPVSRGKETTSRPTSSHSRPTSSHMREVQTPRTPSPQPEATSNTSSSQGPIPDAQLPLSPSRTMDQRRWSPTKNSWMDAALNKPESPKPKATPTSHSPAWMVELNKNKTERAKNPSVDLGRPATPTRKHEVQTGGLVRPTPLGSSSHARSTGSVSSPRVLSTESTTTPTFRSSTSKPTSQASSSEAVPVARSPFASKAKPDTPPQQDFRANLKTRKPPPTAALHDDGSDFQNVFGSLRRTKTQNYVAPDELKHNILRGKAGLAVTDGPRVYQKKDEFKDAILSKKEAFKEAKAEGRGVKVNANLHKDASVPEGLAKRAAMRSSVMSGDTRQKESNRVERNPADSHEEQPVSSSAHTPPPAARKAELMGKPGASELRSDSLQKKTSAPARMETKPSVSSIANRFNPALAGLLARGPPSATPSTSRSVDTRASQDGSSKRDGGEVAPGPQLTHMTKGRARGPKRKAPTSVIRPQAEPLGASSDAAAPKSLEKLKVAMPQPSQSDLNAGATTEKVAPPPNSPTKQRPRSQTGVQQQVAALAAKAQEPLPKEASKGTSEVPEGSISKRKSQLLSETPKMLNDTQPTSLEPKKVPTSPIRQPQKLDMKRSSQFLAEVPSVDTDSVEQRQRSLSPARRRLPHPATPTASSPDKASAEPVVSVKNGAAIFGGAMTPKRAEVVTRSVPEPLKLQPKSPVKQTTEPSALQTPRLRKQLPLSQPESPIRSPVRASADISHMITNFFGPQRPRQRYTVDASKILQSKVSHAETIKTQNAQLLRVLSGNKKANVSQDMSNVLFEHEMYICPHAFEDKSRKLTRHMYFWVGDGVPRSVVEDAQLFAGREARSVGAKLVVLQQGRETPEFIQALGGLLIIRRSSSVKYDSLASSILCGRRFLGQVVFDEVDFAPSSLCSGFPYLVSKAGQCSLWKGKGSGVDEIGCARLVGMNLALMGELTEVDEGGEGDKFWSLFGGEKRDGSADHWRLKPTYDAYCCRLFCSDVGDRKQIIEIHPFTQTDLSSSKIYILDAFFELYVIVGRDAQSQYASFRNALEFAQDYAIFAPTMEDRPFVPISSVVLEGVPRDLRSVFRKWVDANCPTRMMASGGGDAAGGRGDGAGAAAGGSGLRRGRSLRVVPLNLALMATKE